MDKIPLFYKKEYSNSHEKEWRMRNYNELQPDYMVLRATFDGWKIPPRYITNYELVLVIKGDGEIRIAGKDIHIQSGSLICFRPGVEHSLWVDREPYMIFYGLHFSLPPEAEPLPVPDVTELEAPQRLEILFKTLYEAYTQKGYLYEWRQNIFLQQILCEVFTILHIKQEPISILRIQKVLSYIHENPCRPLTLEDLLKQAHIQKTLFLQSFRKVTGTTPRQYIIGLRLEIARDLLLETELPIAAVAEKCGFPDSFYFSRCFKKHFSLSPKQYRDAKRK